MKKNKKRGSLLNQIECFNMSWFGKKKAFWRRIGIYLALIGMLSAFFYPLTNNFQFILAGLILALVGLMINSLNG